MEALTTCDPAEAVKRAVRVESGKLVMCGRQIPLHRKGRLLVLAYGKAAGTMLDGLLTRIGEADGRRQVECLLVESERSGGPRSAKLVKLTRIRGEHPYPGRSSFTAGRRALQFASTARANDDVIFLASGGGSTMMAAPISPLKSTDKIDLHRALYGSGAPIGVVNTIRKHFSAVKGGRVAVAARRAASMTTLIVSDADPAHHDEVASGPSVPDSTTFDDMVAAIDRYGIAPALSVRLMEVLRSGRLPETPKPKDPVFRRARSAAILANRELRGAALREGLMRGLAAEVLGSEVTGPVEDVVESIARVVESAPSGTRLLVLGGEATTIPLGRGRGGRAQELALRLAMRLAGLPVRPWVFLALGSDGVDGNSPAAGAIVDQTTIDRARLEGVDPRHLLEDSNSHRFFVKLGDQIVTGPTGTNVRDLYLLLTGEINGLRAVRVPRPISRGAPDRGSSRPGSKS